MRVLVVISGGWLGYLSVGCGQELWGSSKREGEVVWLVHGLGGTMAVKATRGMTGREAYRGVVVVCVGSRVGERVERG